MSRRRMRTVGERYFGDPAFRDDTLPFDDAIDHTFDRLSADRLIDHCLADNLLRFGGRPDGFAGRRRWNGCPRGVCKLLRFLQRFGGWRRKGVRAYEFHCRFFAIGKVRTDGAIQGGDRSIEKRERGRRRGCEVCARNRELLLSRAGDQNKRKRCGETECEEPSGDHSAAAIPLGPERSQAIMQSEKLPRITRWHALQYTARCGRTRRL